MITEISNTNSELLAAAATLFRRTESAREFAALPHSIAFVAHHDETVTGYCWGYLLHRLDNSSMVYIHDLEVASDYRRQGVGRGLMLAMIEAAKNRGATKLFLTTGTANLEARRLYETIGGQIADQGDTTSYWWEFDRR